ncbi:unnamed protein product [Gongylonema pulchrum]|uniref:ABC transmembrane type-1 domain-containing protein n=1 Tax=Gongylonema pulchrum TaxID=637853 RepID=A0A183DT20_9BILA|nr:unnamed protein product [Gongylonema pulchrum]
MDGRFPKLRKNAEAAACCLSRYSFLFVMPTLVRGYQRQLEENDMYEPLPEQDSETATRRMTDCIRSLNSFSKKKMSRIIRTYINVHCSHRAWEKEKRLASKANRKPSMVKVVRRIFAKRFILTGILIFVENIFHLLQPVALGLLIRYFRYDSPLSKRDAYLAALGVGMTSIMIPIIHHPYFHCLLKFGLELKTACSGMIMEKVSIFFFQKCTSFLAVNGAVSRKLCCTRRESNHCSLHPGKRVTTTPPILFFRFSLAAHLLCICLSGQCTPFFSSLHPVGGFHLFSL